MISTFSFAKHRKLDERKETEEEMVERLCKISTVTAVIRRGNFRQNIAYIYDQMTLDERNRIRAIPNGKERIQEIREYFSDTHQNLIQKKETEKQWLEKREFMTAYLQAICDIQNDLDD